MKLADRDISRWRLHTQRLVGGPFAAPYGTVGHLLGVQAENYVQAAWAVAARSSPVRLSEFDAAFDSGAILRTHILRTTWHFVLPEDIVWLCALGEAKLSKLYVAQLHGLGVDNRLLDAAVAAVVNAIESDGPLGRTQIRNVLAETGIPAGGLAITLITAWAEAHALVCSGVMREGEQTYDLVAHRAPHVRTRDRTDALAEIAWRYIVGHGPATERDLAYWATLSLGDARSGLNAVSDRLSWFDHDGRRFWHVTGDEPPTKRSDSVLVLQILDELYRGYQDSRWVLDADQVLTRERETSLGMVLIDGQVVASASRNVTADSAQFTVVPNRKLTTRESGRLAETVERYGTFLGRPATVRIVE